MAVNMRVYLMICLVSVHMGASWASMVPATVRHARKPDEASCLSQPKLICVIRGTEGNKVEGIVRYKPVWMKGMGGYECNVRIRAMIKGLSPGKHGFHIHTYGDISVGDGTSTGGHFSNPWAGEKPHGLPSRDVRHWGDLGNIASKKTKMARYSRINRMITIHGITGRGMTIHAEKDKGYGFQPSGDAGSRVANCVIGIANPDV